MSFDPYIMLRNCSERFFSKTERSLMIPTPWLSDYSFTFHADDVRSNESPHGSHGVLVDVV